KMENPAPSTCRLPLWEPEAYAVKVANEEFLYGMFYGSMLCIIVFNLLIYFSVRDVGYLYYIGYLAGITLLFFIDLGHGVNLFDDGGEIFHKDFLNTIIWLNWIAVCGFLRAFLETRGNYPLIDAFFSRVTIIAAIYMVLDLFMPYKVSISWAALSTLVLFMAFAPICVYIWRKGNVNALYFLVAWGLNMVGLSIYSLVSLGHIPSSTLLTSLAPLGILSEAVLLSFALAERVKRTQRTMVAADQRAMDHLSRYQSLFDNAVEGIYQLSLDGKFLKVNPSMARNLGFRYPRELTAQGHRAVNFCYSSPRTQYRTLLEKGQLSEETCYTRRDGSLAWADHSARLIYDEEGDPSHIEGTFTDITERKWREEAERQREQERADKEVAKSLAAAKTEFLATMSHQIRTPLTAVIGHSEAIRSLNLTGSEREDAVKTIAHSSQHLLKLINEILDYSKIEAGKFELEQVPVELDELLYQIQHRFHWQAEQKGLEFSIHYPTDVPDTVLTDPARLRYILECLCANGVKYTRQGFVKVTVSWQDQQYLMIRVIDSGIGMSSQEVARLFNVFSLHDASQVREYGGSRLSMAIARELARLLGGDLTVESTPGNGTEFCLWFRPQVPADAGWIKARKGLVREVQAEATTAKPAQPKLSG
ncbi:MAG: 7TM diverse intracellular signaling domain-containing protein, partial [Ketobacteraceae bacterium]|nr:7TM diverse intracellular signaling domain-containing protein [Ketobacteraceae bacterium]